MDVGGCANVPRPWQEWGSQSARRGGSARNIPVRVPVLIQVRYPPILISKIDHWSCFQIGNEHHLAHGEHFLFETRPMIDFQIGIERYGGPFRYLGRRAIFLTQTLRAAGIWIFSTQIFP